jgi:hypothetical protein
LFSKLSHSIPKENKRKSNYYDNIFRQTGILCIMALAQVIVLALLSKLLMDAAITHSSFTGWFKLF